MPPSEVDEDEMLILAEKIPERIKRRVFERPEVFRALALCDDKTLDWVMDEIEDKTTRRKRTKAVLKQKAEEL